jgi:hypothetical protein
MGKDLAQRAERADESRMKRYIIQLTDDERAGLETLIGRGRVHADRARRARIVLLADSGLTDEEIVDELSVGVATVERTRRACVMKGLVAAVERKGRPRPMQARWRR